MFKPKASAPQSDFFSATIADCDPEVADAIGKELGRQQHEIELIASENIVSKAVLEAAGTVLTNKYAEGYPGCSSPQNFQEAVPALLDEDIECQRLLFW